MPSKPRLAPVAKPVGLDPVTILKERENRLGTDNVLKWKDQLGIISQSFLHAVVKNQVFVSNTQQILT